MGPNEGSRVHPLVEMRGVLLETSGQCGALLYTLASIAPPLHNCQNKTRAPSITCFHLDFKEKPPPHKQCHLPSLTPSSAKGLLLNSSWLSDERLIVKQKACPSAQGFFASPRDRFLHKSPLIKGTHFQFKL